MARITIVESIYYQEGNDNPIVISSPPYETYSENDIEPYIKKYVVDKELVSVDFGEISFPGMIYLKNQSREAMVKVPEMNLAVPPGCSIRFWMEEKIELSLIATEERTPILVKILAK